MRSLTPSTLSGVRAFLVGKFMTARKLSPDQLPHWPRLLSAEMAAAYVGLSEGTFATLGIRSVEVRARKLYDRKLLDEWADELSDFGRDVSSDDWTKRLENANTNKGNKSR